MFGYIPDSKKAASQKLNQLIETVYCLIPLIFFKHALSIILDIFKELANAGLAAERIFSFDKKYFLGFNFICTLHNENTKKYLDFYMTLYDEKILSAQQIFELFNLSPPINDADKSYNKSNLGYYIATFYADDPDIIRCYLKFLVKLQRGGITQTQIDDHLCQLNSSHNQTFVDVIIKQKHGGAILFFFNYGFTKTAAVLAKFNVAGIGEAVVVYVKKIVNHKEAILALQNILDPTSPLGKFLRGSIFLRKF
jgi:hypothetical protein